MADAPEVKSEAQLEAQLEAQPEAQLAAALLSLRTGAHTLLMGPAGTGKSLVLNAHLKFLAHIGAMPPYVFPVDDIKSLTDPAKIAAMIAICERPGDSLVPLLWPWVLYCSEPTAPEIGLLVAAARPLHGVLATSAGRAIHIQVIVHLTCDNADHSDRYSDYTVLRMSHQLPAATGLRIVKWLAVHTS
jgi:hypothetical protein